MGFVTLGKLSVPEIPLFLSEDLERKMDALWDWWEGSDPTLIKCQSDYNAALSDSHLVDPLLKFIYNDTSKLYSVAEVLPAKLMQDRLITKAEYPYVNIKSSGIPTQWDPCDPFHPSITSPLDTSPQLLANWVIYCNGGDRGVSLIYGNRGDDGGIEMNYIEEGEVFIFDYSLPYRFYTPRVGGVIIVQLALTTPLTN